MADMINAPDRVFVLESTLLGRFKDQLPNDW